MTAEQKARLAALRATAEKTAEEQSELTQLEALEASDGGDKSYGEEYVKALRSESAKYRTAKNELEKKLATFDGVDVEEYRSLKEAKEQIERDKLAKGGELEKLREKFVSDHQKDINKFNEEKATLEAKVKVLEGELSKTILCHEISAAAAVAKALNPKLVEMAVLSQVGVETDDNGNRIIKVLDSEGNSRIDLKTGKRFSIMQLIEEMKQTAEYAMLFSGGATGASSGTKHVFQGSNINNPWKKDTFNLTMQARIVNSDPNLAARLRAEAGVA